MFQPLDRDIARKLALWSQVVGGLRATARRTDIRDWGEDYTYELESLAQPERTLSMFKAVAYGHALSHLWGTVTVDDLVLVRHIALSSGYRRRGLVFRALLEASGSASSTELEDICGLSKPTVLKAAAELQAAGLAILVQLGGSAPSDLSIAPQFAELCSPRA
jgi:hypothetical protein